MGAGGIPNRGVERVDGRSGDLPVRGAKPNSRYDLYSNDVRIQSRWFDSKGNVVRNRDYIHQNSKNDHFFPHDHVWDWSNGYAKRNKKLLEPDYTNYF